MADQMKSQPKMEMGTKEFLEVLEEFKQIKAQQDKKIADLTQRLSQLEARPNSAPTAPGFENQFLLSKGWEPEGITDTGVEMWKEPPRIGPDGKPWMLRKKLCEIPILNRKGANQKQNETFERIVVPSNPGTYTTSQATFLQSKRDTERNGAKVVA